MGRIDTSISGFAKAGIKITEKQFNDLSVLNMQCYSDGKNAQVFNMILLLRILGLLPEEIKEQEKDLSEFERKFGVRG